MKVFSRDKKLGVKLYSRHAHLPTAGSKFSAGLDLCAAEDGYIAPGCRKTIDLGIGIKLPSGHYGRIGERSGMASKFGIQVLGGIVDPDYNGPLHVVLYNCGEKGFQFEVGDRICQLICERFSPAKVLVVENLPETERSHSGFGSTGMRGIPCYYTKSWVETKPIFRFRNWLEGCFGRNLRPFTETRVGP